MTDETPWLERFAHEQGLAPETLLEALELEAEFHERILKEADPQRRRELYADIYARVHPLYYGDGRAAVAHDDKRGLVSLFSRELRGKSVLDVGCGQGAFLKSLAQTLPHGRLVGLDTSSSIPESALGIEFLRADVSRFGLSAVGGQPFDVVVSDNVIEHLAPADQDAHVASIRAVLRPGGALLLMAPNRLFGPSDVTRVVDASYTNRVPARGTHLCESTYEESLVRLRRHGFSRFQTVLPLGPLKHRAPFRRVRLAPRWLTAIERRPRVLGLLYRLKLRGRCMARFGITLVCR